MTKANLTKLNNSLKGFLNVITEDDLLCYNKDTGEMVVAGKPLSPEITNQVISEIKTLKNGLFWQFMMKDIVYTQNHVLNERANNTDDIIFHRAVKHNLKVISNIIENWDKLADRPKKPTE